MAMVVFGDVAPNRAVEMINQQSQIVNSEDSGASLCWQPYGYSRQVKELIRGAAGQAWVALMAGMES